MTFYRIHRTKYTNSGILSRYDMVRNGIDKRDIHTCITTRIVYLIEIEMHSIACHEEDIYSCSFETKVFSTHLRDSKITRLSIVCEFSDGDVIDEKMRKIMIPTICILMRYFEEEPIGSQGCVWSHTSENTDNRMIHRK